MRDYQTDGDYIASRTRFFFVTDRFGAGGYVDKELFLLEITPRHPHATVVCYKNRLRSSGIPVNPFSQGRFSFLAPLVDRISQLGFLFRIHLAFLPWIFSVDDAPTKSRRLTSGDG